MFSPVVKMSSIKVVLGLAASLDLEIEQLDVKTTFLHGDLEEEIYMEQPEGFEVTTRKIWCADFIRASMVLNKRLGNGIRNLIHLWLCMILRRPLLTIVSL